MLPTLLGYLIDENEVILVTQNSFWSCNHHSLRTTFFEIAIYNGLCNGYRTLPLSVAFVIYRSAFTSRSAFGAGLDSDQAIRA